jgi:hypothetical protein
MNKLSPEKIYEILWEFAQAMCIEGTIDYNFFKSNSDEAKWLLQMFRNITGFEWRIPLNIINNWKVIGYLCCYDNGCWFDGNNDDNNNVALLSGL